MALDFQNFFKEQARRTLTINDFIPRVSDLFTKMITKSGNGTTLTKQIKAVFHRYPIAF